MNEVLILSGAAWQRRDANGTQRSRILPILDSPQSGGWALRSGSDASPLEQGCRVGNPATALFGRVA